MSSNDLYAPGYCKSVIASYPTSPVSGGVVLYGLRTGVAITDEDSDGYTSVNFGPGDYNLSVTDVNTGGIAVGDSLFASQATPVVLSNLSTGVFFGYANEIVGDGLTTTISVHHVADTGGILGSGSIGATQLATDAVTGAKITIPIDLSSKTPGTTTTGTVIKVGTSATPFALNTANQTGSKMYFSTTATSGETYGEYVKLDVSGAGVEGIAGRSRTLIKVDTVGNAHGRHDSLETDTSAGAVTGLATGHRANLVLADRAIAAGTYYGAMAEIYPTGNTAALPANSNACLGINAQAGTAMDAVVNAISFGGTAGSGKMIYVATDSSPTFTGSIRILVNGAVKYLHFTDAEAAGS